MKWLAALLSTALISTPAQIIQGDFSEFLERSAEAEFSGERLISCSTPDGVRDSVLEITQTSQSLVYSSSIGEGGAVRTGQGMAAVVDSGGSLRFTEVSSEDSSILRSNRYRTREPERGVFLGRNVEVIIVERDEIPRARLVFDEETGALLRSLVLGKHRVYCDARMISFHPSLNTAEIAGISPPDPANQEQVRKLETVDDFDRNVFPSRVEDFRRIDQFRFTPENKDDSKQVLAYYTDGFFSFTLLHSRNPLEVADSEQMTRFNQNGGTYQRHYGSGTALHVWETPRGGLAAYGDLPPDLWEVVLEELPHPGKPSVFTRWWRQLFG